MPNPQPEENFYLAKEGKYSWRAGKCKNCRFLKRKLWGQKNKEKFNAYMREYNAEHKDSKKFKERYQNRSLKRRYGLTLDQFKAMLEEQNHTCLLCGRTTAQLKKKLVMDHCHLTGKIRGLLCHGCNRSIALFDNPELFEKATAYINKHRT